MITTLPWLSADEQPPEVGRLLALAEQNPRRAVTQARTNLEGASGAAPWPDFVLGWAHLRWERLDDARHHLHHAANTFTPTSRYGLLCRYALTMARQLGGAGAPLQDAWQALVNDLLAAGQPDIVVAARNEQIAHLNLLGRGRDAYTLAITVEQQVTLHGRLADQARWAQVAGVAAVANGDYERGEALLSGACGQFLKLRRPIDVARVLFEYAWLADRRKEYDRVQGILQRALRIFRRYDLPFRVALCLKDLGSAAFCTGDYATGMKLTLQARGLFLDFGRSDHVARCDMNQGTIAHYSGLFTLARAAYHRAEAAYQSFGNQHLAMVCRRNEALMLLAEGMHAEALTLLDELAILMEATDDPYEQGELALARAQTLHALGREAEALESLDQASSFFTAMQNRPSLAECMLERGQILLDQGDLVSAEKQLAGIHELLHDRPMHTWRSMYLLGRIAARRGNYDIALDCYRNAAHIVARLRRPIVNEQLSSAIFVQAGALFEDALALAVTLNEHELLLQLCEEQRALTLRRLRMLSYSTPPPRLQATYEAIREQLRTLLWQRVPAATLEPVLLAYSEAIVQARHFYPEAPPSVEAPLQLGQLREILSGAYGRSWSVLVTCVVAGEIVLITFNQQQLQLDRIPFDEEVRQLLERACLPRYRFITYRDIDRLKNERLPAYAVLSALGELLIPPALRRQLEPAHRLIIVAGGPLYTLPWAALRIEGAWLCERAVVEHMPSLTSAQIYTNSSRHERKALALGCDRIGTRAAPLTNAEASLELVARSWPDRVTLCAGVQATRQRLLELSEQGHLREYELVHIAGHAYLSSAGGLLAHIKLADDDLLVDEIARLELDAAVVVLAACTGAAGEVLPGDEVLSLAHAWLQAGAACVIAGLWQVYDGVALDLLAPFYAAIRAGDDPAAALAAAQRILIHARSDNPEHAMALASPLVWGGFRAVRGGLMRRREAGGTTPATSGG